MGLSMADLDALSIGMICDMMTEANNDSEYYGKSNGKPDNVRMATQADIDML